MVVERGDGYRREWDDVIVGARDGDGPWKVFTLGDAAEAEWAERESVRTAAGDGRSTRIERRTALAPAGFDPAAATAFLTYVVYMAARDRPWWQQALKPRLEFSLPGVEGLPARTREAFEGRIADWGAPTLLNGRPAKAPRKRWAEVLLVGAIVIAVEFALDGLIAPLLRNLWVLGGVGTAVVVGVLVLGRRRRRGGETRPSGSDSVQAARFGDGPTRGRMRP